MLTELNLRLTTACIAVAIALAAASGVLATPSAAQTPSAVGQGIRSATPAPAADCAAVRAQARSGERLLPEQRKLLVTCPPETPSARAGASGAAASGSGAWGRPGVLTERARRSD